MPASEALVKRPVDSITISAPTDPHGSAAGSFSANTRIFLPPIVNELNVPDYDVLEINASRERGIGEVRDRITNFISMMPFGPFKVVLLS